MKRSPPPTQGSRPKASLTSAASLPLRFWSGAVAQRAPRSSAVPPPFTVWRDAPLQADGPPKTRTRHAQKVLPTRPKAAQPSVPVHAPADEIIRPSAAPPPGVQPRQMAAFLRALAGIMDAPCPVRAAPVITLMDHNGTI